MPKSLPQGEDIGLRSVCEQSLVSTAPETDSRLRSRPDGDQLSAPIDPAATGRASHAGIPPAAPFEHDVPPEAGSRQIAEFSLIKPLGQGSMGKVYLAQDTFLDRLVAVKLLLSAKAHASARERFYTEARAVARLQHPNVVTLYRAGNDQDQPYLVSEFVHGESLDRRQKPVPSQEVLAIGIGIARGLEVAHRHGVLHRDIKPANVMVRADGEVKLLDFGLAKILEIFPSTPQLAAVPAPEPVTDLDAELPDVRASAMALPSLPLSLTRTGTVLGTPLYMAPEIWRTEEATPQSDIYSLGAVLYELCSGQAPHSATTLEQLGSLVTEEDIPPLVEVSPSTDVRLSAIIEHCLHRNPAQRFASVQELRQELEALQRQLATPVGRRNWLALAILLMLVSALAWLSLEKVKANHQIALQQKRQREQAQAAEQERLLAERRRNVERGLLAQDLAREPGREMDALTQGILALGSELVAAHPPSLQTTAGLRAAVTTWPLLNPGRYVPGSGWWSYSARFSPDGKRLMVRGSDATRLWDLPSRRALFTWQNSGDGRLAGDELVGCAFSPDGTRALSFDNDQVQIFSTSTGKCLQSINLSKGIPLDGRFFQDGVRILASTNGETNVTLWGMQGVPLAILRGHRNQVTAASFSEDGTRIVTASDDGTARLWDGHTGQPLGAVLQHPSPVAAASWAPDNRRVVTIDQECTARVFDAQTGAILSKLRGTTSKFDLDQELFGPIVKFSADGNWVISSCVEKVAHLWDSHNSGRHFTLSGHSRAIRFIAVSKIHPQVVTIDESSPARLWDINTGRLLAVLIDPAPEGRFRFGEFSPDGALFVTTDYGQTRIWDLYSMAVESMLIPNTEGLTAASLVGDGRRILTLNDSGVAKIWNRREGTLSTSLSGHPGRFRLVYSSPLAKQIVTLGTDNRLRLWDGDTGKLLPGFDTAQPVLSAAFSPNGREVWVSHPDGGVSRWNLATRQQLSVLQLRKGPIQLVAASSDGRRLVVGYPDKTQLLDANSGREIATFDRIGHVSSAAFAPDGRRVVTTDQDFSAAIWDAENGSSVALLAGHTALIHSAAYSTDGSLIVTASADYTARLWDARSGTLLGVLSGHEAPVRSALFSQDGKLVITIGSDGTIRSHPVTPESLLATACNLLAQGNEFDGTLSICRQLSEKLGHDRQIPGLRNMDFAEGDPGQPPQGWWLPLSEEQAGYRAIREANCRQSGQSCVMLSMTQPSVVSAGNLTQLVDAAPYRGKRVRLRGAVRAEFAQPGGDARLLLGVDPRSSIHRYVLDMFDTAGNYQDWQDRELIGDIPGNAEALNISLQLRGNGYAWFGPISLEIVEPGQTREPWWPEPKNLDLMEGKLGAVPDGWNVLAGTSGGVRAALADSSREPSRRMVCIEREHPERSEGAGDLYQIFDASRYRGKRLRLWAALNASQNAQGFDAMVYADVLSGDLNYYRSSRSIARGNGWTEKDIVFEVPNNARMISLGFRLSAAGRLCAESVRLETLDAPNPSANDLVGIGLQNPSFEQGEPGKPPVGWSLGAVSTEDCSAVISEDRPKHGNRCVYIEKATTVHGYCSFRQQFSASAYTGKKVRLRAAIRAEVANPTAVASITQTNLRNHAQLWLRVDRKGGRVGAYDNMSLRRISLNEWREYVIIANVAEDAEKISVGLMLHGAGKAWLDDIHFDVIGDSDEGLIGRP